MGVQDHLRIAVSHADARVVLTLEGELDMATAPLLQRAVEDDGLTSKHMLVLDLHKLEFIDSTGLRVILAARKQCRDRGQELAITRGSPQVERLLSVTGMAEHLNTLAEPG